MQIINAGRRRKKRDTRMFQLPSMSYLEGNFFLHTHNFFDNLNFPALFLQVPPAVGVVAVDVANVLVGEVGVEIVI